MLVDKLCSQALLTHLKSLGLPVSVQAHAQEVLRFSQISDIKDGCEPCLDVLDVCQTFGCHQDVINIHQNVDVAALVLGSE